MQDLKMQDMKIADQIPGHKNAQPENATYGSCYARLHTEQRRNERLRY